jgi:hypothetical protein
MTNANRVPDRRQQTPAENAQGNAANPAIFSKLKG